MLENHKGNIINHLEFADHHDYSNNDVQKILNKNAEIKPDYINALVKLGTIEQELENYEEAIEYYENALNLDMRRHDVYFVLAFRSWQNNTNQKTGKK